MGLEMRTGFMKISGDFIKAQVKREIVARLFFKYLNVDFTQEAGAASPIGSKYSNERFIWRQSRRTPLRIEFCRRFLFRSR